MIAQPLAWDNADSHSGAAVVISLFGPLTLTVNGQVVTRFRSNKARALLAYLLLAQPQPVLRASVSELLWSGYAEPSALANLRQTLTNLRDCLTPVDLIEASRTHLSMPRDSAVLWCDVHEFERLLERCRTHEHTSLPHCQLCRTRLQAAIALYTAPLLEEFPTIDSAPFTAWLTALRTRLAGCLAEAQAMLAASNTAPGNLPIALTSLIGRTVELAQLEHYLQNTVYRCTSLVGPGGIGKTRLACALAARLQAQFPDGVWLIELSRLAPPTPDETPEQLQDRLAIAIAQTLGLTFMGTTPPAAQVAHFLDTKTALLILDSFEHLLPAAAWLPSLLIAAPRLRLLITTRHRLPLQSQLVYGVEGLGIPPEATAEYTAAHLLTQYASLQLFVERAESAGIHLPLDPESMTTMGQLCRFVGGSPWAIELAVALLDYRTPATILAAIQANYRALTSTLVDIPLRQRSAAAVFHTSWNLLTPTEAQTLARCAVFRGSFTLAMAQTIAAATPAIIEALVQKSLLQPNGADRYTMHDLVRQFASEQLALDASAATQTYTAHAAHFMALLATWQPTDAVMLHFRTAVAQDWANVQAAWGWAVETGAVVLLQQGVDGLAMYYNLASLLLEADVVFGHAVDRVRRLVANGNCPKASTEASDHCHLLPTLLVQLLWRQCCFVNDALADLARAQPLVEELLARAQELNDEALLGRGYYECAILAFFQGDLVRQEQLTLQALPLVQQHGTIDDQLACFNILGVSRQSQGDYATALAYFQQALQLARQQTYGLFEVVFLANIGSLYIYTGHFTAAITFIVQALARTDQLAFNNKGPALLVYLGTIALLCGDYAEARARLQEAYQRAVDIHDPVAVAESLAALGTLSAEVGDDPATLTYCQRALAAPGGQLYSVQHSALCTLGHLYRRQGQWDAATAVYQQALSLSQAAKQPMEEVRSQIYLAVVTLGRGDAPAALAAVEPLLARLAANPFPAHQRPHELLLMVHKILVTNQDPRAAALLCQAWEILQDQTAKLDDPRLRETFLTKVPVHQELAVLMAADPHLRAASSIRN